ncbi:MAG: response regulator [Acidobacteriia bacterium]|nr:response regulator [Terriglobia bacterium]
MARKILLADDSVTAQNMGRKILADAGYDVATVNNGSAALKRINELKPDLIVLDVYMPGYSGLEVCQRLKDAPETAHIPVLLTVGKLEPFKPEEARRVRADAHIVKPFEASELLTAITRLEDRMVPQHSDGSRFSTSISGVERFGGDGGRKTESNDDADTGWKSRLRFPSKKKKEEPEPEPEDAAATFREFRKGKGKAGPSAPFTVKAAPPPGQEPGLVPDIPRDITPEELDALSALAAKLDGPIPAAENIAPLAEKMGPVEAPAAEVAAAKTEAAKTEEVPAPAAEAKSETKNEEKPEEKVAETPAPAVEPAAVAVAAQESAVESKSRVEIPVAQTELAAAPVAEVATPAAVVPVDAAALVEEPAPVDRADEPMFASAASAVEQAPAEKIAEEKIEEKPVEAIAKSEVTQASASAEAVVAKDLESRPEESQALESKAEESKAEKIEQPVAASVPEATEAEEPAPSDEELAEALRLLTPATGHADVSTIPSHGTLVAAGQLLAEEAARNAAEGPRWIAESVALSPEEAAISLEAEMFRTFATTPATVPAITSGGAMDAVGITGVSAIAAAVENRLASMELAAGANGSAGQKAKRASAESGSQITAAETAATEASAEVTAPVSTAATPLVDEAAQEEPAPEKVEAKKIEVEQKDSPAKAAEEAPVEEVAAATFADAMSTAAVEPTAEQSAEPVSSAAAVAEENQDTNSEVGGQESMARDAKGKSGKSNWHQIRTAPAGATASSDVVEAAKQAERGAEEAPKAMAAAASADGSASTSAPDASTIASIVDSVMADLRPKIVEEIAKKLAGK